MSHYKLTIFDFDGTLVNKLPVKWENVRNELSRIISNNNLGITQLVDLVRNDVNKLSRVMQIIESSESKSIEMCEPLEKSIEIYKKLCKNGKQTAIFTTNCKSTVQKFLRLTNLVEPNFMVTLEDVSKSKPDPEGINKIIELSLLSKHEIVMIGDSQKDKESADRAGCSFIHVNELESEINNII